MEGERGKSTAGRYEPTNCLRPMGTCGARGGDVRLALIRPKAKQAVASLVWGSSAQLGSGLDITGAGGATVHITEED